MHDTHDNSTMPLPRPTAPRRGGGANGKETLTATAIEHTVTLTPPPRRFRLGQGFRGPFQRRQTKTGEDVAGAGRELPARREEERGPSRERVMWRIVAAKSLQHDDPTATLRSKKASTVNSVDLHQSEDTHLGFWSFVWPDIAPIVKLHQSGVGPDRPRPPGAAGHLIGHFDLY